MDGSIYGLIDPSIDKKIIAIQQEYSLLIAIDIWKHTTQVPRPQECPLSKIKGTNLVVLNSALTCLRKSKKEANHEY